MQSSTGIRFETVFLGKNAPGDDRTEQLICWCKRFDKLGLAPKSAAVSHVHDELVVGFADELDLPCTEGEQPSGSYELVKEVQRVLGLRKDVAYLVLRNRGVTAIGKTVTDAGRLAENTNKMARNLTRRKGV